jgi:cytochrome c biogenesis protein CcdA/thiol-disulfide isomerase/thioredoxin
MTILILFAFLAGIVTILSPCILPVLPLVLSSSVTGSQRRPLGVVLGFVASFTFFTLFLSTLVKLLHIPADSLRLLAVIVISLFGLSLLLPQTQLLLERLFTKLSRFTPQASDSTGFSSGFLIGISIGLVWTPCVGPILASIISLALAGTVTGSAVFITLAYSLGTALPMLAVIAGGRQLLNRVPWLTSHTSQIQKAFGLLMLVTAVGIFFNLDRRFQVYLLNRFPNYGTGLTQFEDNPLVRRQLDQLPSNPQTTPDLGQPMPPPPDSSSTLAPELIPGGQWFNLPPGQNSLTLADLRGRVVLIDFWTYTCINCIRTLPYLKSWYAKYQPSGLTIIGVHTPEFEFEKDPDNLQKAISDFGLTYPIVQDNDYATWQAYDNHYWPAKYLIDKDGRLRYTHFGEGKYDETEQKIQELLAEIGSSPNLPIDNPDYQVDTRTPELYLGSDRLSHLANPDQFTPGQPTTFQLPKSTPLHDFSFSGTWTVYPEYSQPSANSTLVLNFYSKDVFLVLRTSDNQPGRLQVTLDDSPLLDSQAGANVQDGLVTVTTNRLYHLIHLENAGSHTLQLQFLDPNLELFAFTFG